jgi:hypothetical protein
MAPLPYFTLYSSPAQYLNPDQHEFLSILPIERVLKEKYVLITGELSLLGEMYWELHRFEEVTPIEFIQFSKVDFGQLAGIINRSPNQDVRITIGRAEINDSTESKFKDLSLIIERFPKVNLYIEASRELIKYLADSYEQARIFCVAVAGNYPESPPRKNQQKNKRKAQSFQPTSTPHDALFREVISAPEMRKLEMQFSGGFMLPEERKHYDALVNARKQSTGLSRDAIDELRKKMLSLSSDLESFQKEFSAWTEVIMPCVRDIGNALRRKYNVFAFAHDPAIVVDNTRKLLWGAELLKLLTEPQAEISDSVVSNYLRFFENPAGSTYFLDEADKERIVTRILGQEYDRERFTHAVFGYFESLGPIPISNSENTGIFITAVLLHERIRPLWEGADAKTKGGDSKASLNDGRFIGDYAPDHPSAEDHLGFRNDVNALAALITYEKTPMPLAIGLFGNWGSGKSSFMKQLQNRVGSLIKTQQENETEFRNAEGKLPYCNKVAHITFNAWHYSDANLWASMMVHIFDELLQKINVPATRETLRNELMGKLSTAEEATKEAQRRLDESTRERLSVEKSVIDADSALAKTNIELGQVKFSLENLFKIVMEKGSVSSAVRQAAEETGYEGPLQSEEDIRAWKKSLTSRWPRVRQAIANLFNTRVTYSWIFLLLTFALPAAVIFFANRYHVLQKPSTWFLSTAAFILPVLKWTRDQAGKFRKRVDRVEEILKQEEEAARQKLLRRKQELDEILEAQKKIEQDNRAQLEQAKQREAEAKAALDSFDINRQLAGFIRERQGGGSYQQHLGIISLIRKDFETLGNFLKTSRVEKGSDERILDRIILYIDDLDRCKTDRVVAVLEAVHLLLALDLFVVVVGVDPRWVSKALREQYRGQLDGDIDDPEMAALPGDRTTPFDYLEKIFQVPFVLRNMNDSGAKLLLDNLFEGQVEKETGKTTGSNSGSGSGNKPGDAGGDKKQQSAHEDPRDEKRMEAERKAFEQEESKRKKEEQKEDVISQVENLSISKAELDFMKSIAPLIGSTPRTVKRYGNLYRLLRVHSDIPGYTAETAEDYRAIMILLAICVSGGSAAKLFFSALKSAGSDGFYKVSKELQSQSPEEKDVIRLHETLGTLPEEIQMFSVKMLRKYAATVARFSFRTLETAELLPKE